MNDLTARGITPSAAFKIMERVRKGRGLTPANAALMRKHHLPEWYIESCHKIKYLLPKAHAVAYALNAMRVAYCKVHHPAAFYASCFTIMRDVVDTRVISQGTQAVRDAIGRMREPGRKPLMPTEQYRLVVLELAAEMIVRGITMAPINLHKFPATGFKVEGTTIIPTSRHNLSSANAMLYGVRRRVAAFLQRDVSRCIMQAMETAHHAGPQKSGDASPHSKARTAHTGSQTAI